MVTLNDILQVVQLRPGDLSQEEFEAEVSKQNSKEGECGTALRSRNIFNSYHLLYDSERGELVAPIVFKSAG